MIFAAGTEEAGWEFVEAFYANLDGKVQDSSGNCHKLVASGEYTVGVTIEKSPSFTRTTTTSATSTRSRTPRCPTASRS
jgi:ABC-type Fe3+ transport system substrate-binding protein